MNQPLLGCSVSPRELAYLNLDFSASINLLAQLPLPMVRYSTFWSDLEPEPEHLNLKPVLADLDTLHRLKRQVVLVVGCKSLRWPEFYLPGWCPPLDHPDFSQTLLRFLERAIPILSRHPAITHLQIENEPFDPSGPDRLTLSLELLTQEINLARSLQPHPLLLTVWGNQLASRNHYRPLLSLSDILGVDLYFSVFLNTPSPLPLYSGLELGTFSTLKSIRHPLWITELQAEPWEKDLSTHLKIKTSSFSPEKLTAFYRRCLKTNPHAVLFWGFEYWAYHALQGNPIYINTIKNLI